MLKFFRDIFKSKIGLAITIAFVGLIGLAFAISDVASTGSVGGVAGGDNVAVVGGEKIGAADLSQSASLAVDQQRQQNPTISMASFVENGGLTDVLDQMIDRKALSWWAQENGLRAGGNLVNSEIRRIPAFSGPDGKFSDAIYRQALVQRKLTDATVRSDLSDGLLAQQILVPAAFGAKMPSKLALRYAALTKERRNGSVAIIPANAFAPRAAPTSAQLATFYAANKARFIRPERRVIRYAEFGEESLGDITPTGAEIGARYQRDRAEKYAGRETRTLTQLIVPTKQAADAIAARGAGALDAAAREAGLQVAKVTATDRAAYAGRSSEAVANAVFAASRGAIAKPARGGLGWYVVRVDGVSQTATQTLEQARGAIAADLLREKKARGLTELAGEIEQQIDEGSALSDVARTLRADVKTTKPIVADGRVYASANETAPEILAPALAAAFEMDEGQPQITAIGGGERYLVFETARITPSAAAPMAEITDDLTAAWRTEQGAKLAKAAADRVIARVAKGQPLAAAVAAETVALPTPQSVNMTREQVAAQGQRVPPPLALLFSMAKNSVKRLEAPNDMGWYVIRVDSIEPGKIAANDPMLAGAKATLGQLLGREYGDALRVAIRNEAGVERNADAVAAVRKQLAGGSEN